MAERDTLAAREIRIQFDGRAHQVDLTVYTQVLLDFASVVKASANTAAPNAEVGVTILAPERGSFVAVLNLVATQAVDMLHWGLDHAGDLANTVTIVGGLYGLHHWAAGRLIDRPAIKAGGGNVLIEDSTGATITVAENVYHIYVNQPAVPAALAHTFSTLDEDPAITGFALTDLDETPVFEAGRGDFSKMAEAPSIDMAALPNVEKCVEEAHLHIVKAVLARNYTRKWEFIWKGDKISANIRDEKFFDRLESHQYTFGAGDVLKVELEITREFDPLLDTFINRSFTIIEVRDFIERPKDIPML